MSKAFDDYSSFNVEKVQPRSAPKRRRFNPSLLLLLVLGYALLLLAVENAGSLTTLLTDIPAQLQRLSQ
jgi:hypothetical protein